MTTVAPAVAAQPRYTLRRCIWLSLFDCVNQQLQPELGSRPLLTTHTLILFYVGYMSRITLLI